MLKKNLLSSSRLSKQILVCLNDFFLICIASSLAITASDVDPHLLESDDYLRLFLIPIFTVFIFYLSGVYRSVLRFLDFSSIYLLIKSIVLSFVLILIFKNLLLLSTLNQFTPYIVLDKSLVTLAGWSIGLLSSIVLIIGSRIFANYYFSEASNGKKVAIYGAGDAGIQLAGALRVSSEMKPVAFIDRNPSLHGTFVGGLKVLNPVKLRSLVEREKVDEVLIAIPSASKSILKELFEEIEKYKVKVRILPGLAELAQGKVMVSELKEVDTSDLLGRYEIEADSELLDRNIKDKIVLITGAGGSIGSELARQVIRNDPKILVILDSNEYSLYSIKNELDLYMDRVNIFPVIANVTNQERISEILKVFGVETIYHTAAYKHVPLVEENPFEGVNNNIFGTLSCMRSALENEVETFVLISTDKAVRPTNIMGATKRFSEMILQAYSVDKKVNSKTRMTMVRFGNVLGSSGSAIPLFQQQIQQGGPVTVTHKDVTRYFMSIPEAAELVIQAGAMGKGGDVFVLDMGEPVKIYDLAKRLINLSGMEVKEESNPEGDIEIIFTGLRPGEKLYEELLIGGNVSSTEHEQILRAEEEFLEAKELEVHLNSLSEAEKNGDVVALRNILKTVVSGYTPEDEIVDIVYLQRDN